MKLNNQSQMNCLFPLIQDCLIKTENLSAKKLIVMLVPEGNFMSGGIYSFFTIAKELKSLKHIHGCDVVVMTRPNVNLRTYVRQTHFRNEFIDISIFTTVSVFRTGRTDPVHSGRIGCPVSQYNKFFKTDNELYSKYWKSYISIL